MQQDGASAGRPWPRDAPRATPRVLPKKTAGDEEAEERPARGGRVKRDRERVTRHMYVEYIRIGYENVCVQVIGVIWIVREKAIAEEGERERKKGEETEGAWGEGSEK